jgi:hypothetical protein
LILIHRPAPHIGAGRFCFLTSRTYCPSLSRHCPKMVHHFALPRHL